MPKKSKKKKSVDDKKKRFGLSNEVKRAIWIVVFFSASMIFFLSLIGDAGRFGVYFNKVINPLFGWGKWAFPFILLLISFFIIGSKDKVYQRIKIISTFVFVFVYSALLHLKIPIHKMVYYAKNGQGGGFVGLVLSYPLIKSTGFIVSLIVLTSLGIISLLLMFETKLFKIGRMVVWILYKMPTGGAFSRFKLKLKDKLKREPEFIEDIDDGVDIAPKAQMKLKLKKREWDSVPEDRSFDDGHKEEKKEALYNADEEVFQKSLISKYRRKIDIPLTLLNKRTGTPSSGDIKANKEKIKKTLKDFGIDVEMGPVSIGPTVTQYTLKPDEGVKLSQITALQNDLALALAAHPIRIEAPIPKRSLVGIEVPNSVIATVGLREVLQSEKFREKRRSNLTLGLGKDVAGEPYIADLESMPHLLIAGATGSGKSVCINACIISLLYQNSPDDLKFILVDPKRVELNLYNGIPHLLTPVVTNAKKTINALKWTVDEMDRRYNLLSDVHARNIEDYNKRSNNRIPYIIIIIDELADLMSVAAKDVEALIVRLAQMARAVGIHLILATQRPSVNVITGLIKANITSRIAFAVASQTDSRTILDSSGAEKLLGRGDMLFVTAELSKPKRLQGAFVSDKEIKRVVKFLKEAAEPDYLDEITETKAGFQMPSIGHAGSYGSEGDELLDEARELVIKAGKASASYLQRHLRIGYARAARILDLLESEGIIGPADGAKPREVLIGKDGEEEENKSLDNDL